MPMHELILGGCKSGKSRCAEQRVAAWLAQPGHDAVLIATALPGDEEMRQRIARHRAERALALPGLRTLDVPQALPQAIVDEAAPQRLLAIDCLTLWLTQALMPLQGAGLDAEALAAQEAALLAALAQARGPVAMVSNEIGLGVMPMGADTRRFVDALGNLHQRVARLCSRVTLMVAGLEVAVKRP